MKRVLVIGQRAPAAALSSLFHNDVSIEYSDSIPADFFSFNAVLDTTFDLNTERLATYLKTPPAILMLHALNSGVSRCLAQQGLPKPETLVIGLNVLPGFAERGLLELSNPFTDRRQAAEMLASVLAVEPKFTEDRVGLVSARILMMVINEAWFTLQEGTAGVSDIDTGMKLGTNYPKGPFEWTKVIGAKGIVATLDALFEDTHDSRYKACASLRQQAYMEIIG